MLKIGDFNVSYDSTTIQFSPEQFSQMNKIAVIKGTRPSNAAIVREAFDFYVSKKYPQLIKSNVTLKK